MAQREILIVANETAGGGHLRRLVQEMTAEQPTRFTLIVPATPPHGRAWNETDAADLAEARLGASLDALRATGADIEGRVGAPRAFEAVYDAMLEQRFDGVIVSTLPHGVSHWLQQRLPQQIRRRFGVPVTHVIGTRATAERQRAG